jgi:hypothetical protein
MQLSGLACRHSSVAFRADVQMSIPPACAAQGARTVRADGAARAKATVTRAVIG